MLLGDELQGSLWTVDGVIVEFSALSVLFLFIDEIT